MVKVSIAPNVSGFVFLSMKKYVPFIKAFLGIGLLVFALNRVDSQELIDSVHDLSFTTSVIALVIFNISMMCNGMRMRFYLKKAGKELSPKAALSLYYTHLFIGKSLFGPITGDGYRAVIFKKFYGLTYRKVLNTLLSERLSGFFTLFCSMLFFLYAAQADFTPPAYQILLGVIIVCVGYRFLAWLLLQETWHTTLFGGAWAILARVIWLGCVALLLMQHDDGKVIEYMLTFSVATGAIIIPASFLGVGPREVALVYLAPMLGLEAENVVLLSLQLAFMALLTAAPGLVFFIRTKNEVSEAEIRAAEKEEEAAV